MVQNSETIDCDSEKDKRQHFRVTQFECNEDSVKLRLKRKSFLSPESANRDRSPTAVLDQLNISDFKEVSNRTPLKCSSNLLNNVKPNINSKLSPRITELNDNAAKYSVKKNSVDVETLETNQEVSIDLCPTVRLECINLSPGKANKKEENVDKNFTANATENSLTNSRRKQSFAYKMYSTQDTEILFITEKQNKENSARKEETLMTNLSSIKKSNWKHIDSRSANSSPACRKKLIMKTNKEDAEKELDSIEYLPNNLQNVENKLKSDIENQKSLSKNKTRKQDKVNKVESCENISLINSDEHIQMSMKILNSPKRDDNSQSASDKVSAIKAVIKSEIVTNNSPTTGNIIALPKLLIKTEVKAEHEDNLRRSSRNLIEHKKPLQKDFVDPTKKSLWSDSDSPSSVEKMRRIERINRGREILLQKKLQRKRTNTQNLRGGNRAAEKETSDSNNENVIEAQKLERTSPIRTRRSSKMTTNLEDDKPLILLAQEFKHATRISSRSNSKTVTNTKPLNLKIEESDSSTESKIKESVDSDQSDKHLNLKSLKAKLPLRKSNQRKSKTGYAAQKDPSIEKSPTNVNENLDIVDVISTKMQQKLGIVTPQKTPDRKLAPRRKRLSNLDEESDDEPLIKLIKEHPSNSTRMSLRNTPRKILVETSEEEKTPTKKISINKKLVSIIQDSVTPRKRKNSEEDSAQSPTKKIGTPKRTPRLRISLLPTQIEARASPYVTNSNPFELARAQLSTSLKPGCLPCREKEFEDITQFINGKLEDNSGGCMYISGVPGTGKTATVCEIMKVMNDGLKKKILPNFRFISVNALSLTEPRQVYVEIVKQMANKKMYWHEALTYIQNFFLKQKHMLHVLLIDELDKLCTRKQDVIYNLLDLPSSSKTPLVVITIANTMDLPERLLSNKVNSRLGLTRLTFKPYKHKELIDIVKARLSAYSRVFRSEALEFIARKVAAVSGDARRALAICGRATEIAEAANEKEITMDIVNKTLNDMISSPKVQAIKSCSKTEKLILQALAHEVSRTGNDEVSFSNIVQVIDGLCILESSPIPNINRLLLACQNLNFFRLIIMQEGRHDVANTLLLNVSSDDIHFALKDK